MQATMYEGRIRAVEERQSAQEARMDKLMLMMVGTLASSLATFIAVVLGFLLKGAAR
jgi:hypothetical protein